MYDLKTKVVASHMEPFKDFGPLAVQHTRRAIATAVLVAIIYLCKLGIDAWAFSDLPKRARCSRDIQKACKEKACVFMDAVPCDEFGMVLPRCEWVGSAENCKICDEDKLYLCLNKREVQVWVSVELTSAFVHSPGDTWMLFFRETRKAPEHPCSKLFYIDGPSNSRTCVAARYAYARELSLKVRRGGAGDWLTVGTYRNIWALAPGYLEGRRLMLLFTVRGDRCEVSFTELKCSQR